jgi:hypothetical protein
MRIRLASLLLSVSLAVPVALGASLALAPTAAAASKLIASCTVTSDISQYGSNQIRVAGSVSCTVPVTMLEDVYTQEYTSAGWVSFYWQSASTTGTSLSKVYYLAPVHGYSYRTSVNFFVWNGTGWTFKGTVNSGSLYLA